MRSSVLCPSVPCPSVGSSSVEPPSVGSPSPLRGTAHGATRARAGLVVAALAVALVAGCSSDDAGAADGSAAAAASDEETSSTFGEWAADTRSALEENRTHVLDALADRGAVSGSGADSDVTAGALPVWGVPVGLDGWTVETLDVGGVNELASDDGCVLGTQQVQTTFTTDDDRSASEEILVQLVGAENYLPVERPLVTVSAPEGRLELLQYQTTFATPDSALEYRFLSRAITEQSSGLVLSYSCPVDVFDEAEWLEMLTLVSVAHTPATTM